MVGTSADTALDPLALDAAARRVYEDKGDRIGVIYVGWDAEPESVKAQWRADVSVSVSAYLAATRLWGASMARNESAGGVEEPGPAFDIQSATVDLQLAVSAVVHTDGGCEPNPGTGGWGVVIDSALGERRIELCGGERSTTNNRMEMTAAIVALTVLPSACATTIVTDSQYLVNGMTKWVAGWRRNGFKKKGTAIPNADLWRTLDALSAGRTVDWRWVRGHNGNALNERADQLATDGRRKALRAAA